MASTPASFQPTTRSRTLLFFSYRDSSARPRRSFLDAYAPDAPDGEHDRLITSSAPHVSLDMSLPPKWVDYAEQVQDILEGTKAKIAALDKLHAKHVLPGFADRSAEEREIDAATTDITKDFRQCHALIQRIEPAPTFPPTAPARGHDALAAKNVQRALAAQIQELSGAFRKKQRVYMDKLQGHAIKNQDLLLAAGVTSLKGPDALSAADEDVQAASLSTQTQQQQQQLVPGSDLRARDAELQGIARSIAQLAELFKDLSALVIDQGTLLDSVEYNIEQTAVNMSDAVRELDVATRYQKSTGRRKCIFLLLLIIFGLVLVLVFKPRRHSAPAVMPPPPSGPPPPESGTDVNANARDVVRLLFAARAAP